MNKQLAKQGIIRFWGLQSGVIVLLTVISGISFNKQVAYSVLLGGLVYIVPTFVFAIKLFKHQGARAARQIVKSFYAGEALKIVLSMFLFALAFIFFKIRPAAFFASYVTVLMTQWLAPWIIINKRKRPESD